MSLDLLGSSYHLISGPKKSSRKGVPEEDRGNKVQELTYSVTPYLMSELGPSEVLSKTHDLGPDKDPEHCGQYYKCYVSETS